MDEALKIILEKLSQEVGDVKFALVGSFNLQTQGIDLTVKDLDLLTDDEGLEKIAKVFTSRVDDFGPYKSTGFMLAGTDVEVVSCTGNPYRLPDFQKYIVTIEKDGLKVPCMSLESELYFYTNAGREKDKFKVGLIKEKMKNDEKHI